MQKGDLVIFGARASRRTVGHVGIFIEMSEDGQDFTFIHAATHGGITVSHVTEEYYAARFLGARRILPDFEIEVPEPEPIDFEAVYGNVFLPIQDTLSLGEADSRLVLFGDGTWAVQNTDGNPGGTWQTLPGSTSGVRVPSLAAGSSAVPAPAPKASTNPAQPAAESASGQVDAEYHVIRSGDTLDRISKAYGTTIDRLCELNGITRKTILHIGRRLRVK